MLEALLDFYDSLWSEELEYIFSGQFDHDRRMYINRVMDSIEAYIPARAL